MKIPKPVQADLALILMTFIWGSTFTIVKKSLAQVSPIFFVAMRFWLATAIVAILNRKQLQRIDSRTLGRGLLLSVALCGGFCFQTLGLRSTGPSYSAFITSLSVLLVPILGFLIFHHQPRPQTIAGVILATLGLFLMLANIAGSKMRSGDVLTLICAVMFGFHILFLGRFVSSSDYRQLMVLQLAGTATLCTVAMPLLERPSVSWNPEILFYLMITGVFATAIAFSVQTWAQRFTTANHTALIFSLEPFFAALFAYWILGQVLTAREWLGGVLILGGILVSELRILPREQ
jgi:drug/metabolite transporter (DMT)-like permease